MSSDTPPPASPEDIQVRLKPLFGVEPKHWLGVLYALLLLALLFAVLVLPGITHPGTRVTVESNPAGASVTWGTKTWGATPVTVFLPAGSATLTVSKPGFQPDARPYTSTGNLFFSLFAPRTESLAVTLKPASANSVTERALAEVGRWALAVPFSSVYRFPPLFTRFAADAKAAGLSDEAVRTFLLSVRSAVADPQMYLDYGRALGLWGASQPVPEGLQNQFNLWKPLVGDNPRLALWLLANQTKLAGDRERAEKSDWLAAQEAAVRASLTKLPAPVGAAPSPLKTALGSYRGVPGSSFAWGSTNQAFSLPVEPAFEVPVPVTTAPFWIAETEVTQAQFAAFVAARPQWAPEARATLTAQGLADADYLAGWNDGKPAKEADPVASVSWYAARAYVDWLNASGQVPAGRRAVLPDDFQWEAAARAPGGASLLNQGVWEWTASAWYPGQALVWTQAAPAEADAYARTLKGGVANTKGSVTAADRAGWPAGGTNAGLGFRVALVGP